MAKLRNILCLFPQFMVPSPENGVMRSTSSACIFIIRGQNDFEMRLAWPVNNYCHIRFAQDHSRFGLQALHRCGLGIVMLRRWRYLTSEHIIIEEGSNRFSSQQLIFLSGNKIPVRAREVWNIDLDSRDDSKKGFLAEVLLGIEIEIGIREELEITGQNFRFEQGIRWYTPRR